MKIIISTILLIVVCQNSFAQQKGDNTIIVQGVGFEQACNALLDQGFIIEKKDNDLKTAKTEFKIGAGKNKWMKYLINVRVKDSTVIITGQWVNTIFLGQKVLGMESTIENSTYPIENTTGNPKRCFNEMKGFALSLNKQIAYSKQ